jgi:glycosyltransferase involved in cell wall biosynthesis
MKILFICNKSPWPAKEGGPIAMNNLIEGMIRAGHQVKVLAAVTNKYSISLNEIPESYREKTGLTLAYIDLKIKPLEAFLNLFTKKSYHVERFISKPFVNKLKDILVKEQFDIVQIELLYMSPYLDIVRKYSSAKVILRAHNIEHLIWKRVASEERNVVKKLYLKHLAKTLENYEKSVLNKFDGIVPITNKDAEFFKEFSGKPVNAVSFGLNIESIPQISEEAEHALFHIGAMNWIPNQEGVKWFIDKVWPEISSRLPRLKLYLAGREMPKWLMELNVKNIVVLGEVPDAYEFIASKTMLIAPLFSGSGIRIKIIESMAMGKAVISTAIGAEGIDYTNGVDIIIADSKKEFVEAVIKLYNNKQKAFELGNSAKNLVYNQHNINKTTKNLEDFYRKILG